MRSAFGRLVWVVAVLSFVAIATPALAQEPEALVRTRQAMTEARFADAEAFATYGFGRETGAARDTLAFFRALAAYEQGIVLARTNVNFDLDIFRRAIIHLERATTLLEATTHPRRPQVLENALREAADLRTIINTRR